MFIRFSLLIHIRFIEKNYNTGLAQLVEHWSPKPGVVSSSLSTRAKIIELDYFLILNKSNNQMAGLVTYIKESFGELKNNVSWTPWPEAQRLTVIVAVFSIIFSLAIWGVDTVFSRAVKAYFDFIH